MNDNIFELLKKNLTDARNSATLERASFGFPDDRIEVKAVHFGDDRTGRAGDVIHPTEYVKKITDLYRHSWIINPLNEALSIIEANKELFVLLETLSKKIDRADIEKIFRLARGFRE